VFEEVNYHPETLKGLEILNYHVEHNIPVEKELCFKLVPELFVHEINRLDYEDRERFEKPKLAFKRADGVTLDIDEHQNIALNYSSEADKLQDKARRMEMYLYEQTQDIYAFYFEKISSEVLYGDHVGLFEYMILLDVMDEENMKDWEKRMMSEIKELRLIEEDIEALKYHLETKKDEIILPEWIMDPQYR
jgi:hypothetical protein